MKSISIKIECPLQKKEPDCDSCPYGKQGLCDYPNGKRESWYFDKLSINAG